MVAESIFELPRSSCLTLFSTIQNEDVTIIYKTLIQHICAQRQFIIVILFYFLNKWQRSFNMLLSIFV